MYFCMPRGAAERREVRATPSRATVRLRGSGRRLCVRGAPTTASGSTRATTPTAPACRAWPTGWTRSAARSQVTERPRRRHVGGGLCPGGRRLRLTLRHRRDDLEVVAVRIGERRDAHRLVGPVTGVVRLRDHRRTGRLAPLEVATDVTALEVPHDATGLLVDALHLVVRRDGEAAVADLPSRVAALVPDRFTEELLVERDQSRRLLRADHDVVQVHLFAPSF